MEKKKVILIGCGFRGKKYIYTMKERCDDYFEVVAIADPNDRRREYVRKTHGLPENMAFKTAEELLSLGKIADVAIIATMDRDHFGPAMKAIELGYNLLLEKPVAPTPEECRKIQRAAEEKGVFVLVCHVLRFAKFYLCLKDVIDSGVIGKIMSVEHIEAVETTHNSHSFIRGKWSNSERSTPMILQKTCHDFDLIAWLTGEKCTKVQSFGYRSYFRPENAPEGAPERCIEGCPHADKCEYNAMKIYYKDKEWMGAVATQIYEPTDDEVTHAMWNTNYGKCIFKCDNDVVDHQTVNLVYGNDITVAFTMCSFTKGGRVTRIMGTKGEIYARMMDNSIEIYDFLTKETKYYDYEGSRVCENVIDSHGGGDTGIVFALRDLIEGNYNKSVATIKESCDNHMISFAAEESRLTGKVIDMAEFEKRFE